MLYQYFSFYLQQKVMCWNIEQKSTLILWYWIYLNWNYFQCRHYEKNIDKLHIRQQRSIRTQFYSLSDKEHILFSSWDFLESWTYSTRNRFSNMVVHYWYKSNSNICKGWSWSWSYGSWIYNYLCNQCLSLLTLWVRTLFMTKCTRYNIMW
jgi:hypothetical protein